MTKGLFGLTSSAFIFAAALVGYSADKNADNKSRPETTISAATAAEKNTC